MPPPSTSPPRSSPQPRPENSKPRNTPETAKGKDSNDAGTNNIAAQTFTFRELATATKNFRQECLVGEDLSPKQKPLDWNTRMRIAVAAARGLEYLHDKANPPVIYRDLKSSNILLDKDFNAKLSDFGLAKLGPTGDKTHVSSRVMGTYGYCAPEYQRTGHLTVKSDVYSFGVVLLELITGRRAMDTTKPADEQNLVSWAQPFFREPKRFPDLADPLLVGDFPVKSLNQVVAIAAMCLQEEETARPFMSDVVTALSFLSTGPEDGSASPLPSEPSPPHKVQMMDEDSIQERQRAVAEAIEWGSNTRQNARS
ncbi:hypothetical protein Ancab_022053 [Ancistrocladus abbreviatus]